MRECTGFQYLSATPDWPRSLPAGGRASHPHTAPDDLSGQRRPSRLPV